MRRLRPLNKQKLGDFRLIRCLGIDLNVARFKKHIRRLERSMYTDSSYRLIKMKMRRRRRTGKSAAIAA